MGLRWPDCWFDYQYSCYIFPVNLKADLIAWSTFLLLILSINQWMINIHSIKSNLNTCCEYWIRGPIVILKLVFVCLIIIQLDHVGMLPGCRMMISANIIVLYFGVIVWYESLPIQHTDTSSLGRAAYARLVQQQLVNMLWSSQPLSAKCVWHVQI